jgi:hypothetical protein
MVLILHSNQKNTTMEKRFNRLGNWYDVEFNNVIYNVLVLKEDNSIYCDPSSVLVFDEDFNKVIDDVVYNGIEEIMNRVDWKYDVVDEEDED